MPALRGTVTLDAKNALKNLRDFRREMYEASKTPTKVGIHVESDAAKVIRGLKNDFRNLKKLGSEHKVEIQAKADTREAEQRLAGVRDVLRDIGKNPHIRITTDTREVVAGIRRVSDEDKAAKEAEKRLAKETADEKKRLAKETVQAEREAKQAERKLAQDTAAEKRRLIAEERRERTQALHQFEREARLEANAEKAAIREVNAERKKADRENAKSARESASARKRANSEARSARGELGSKFDNASNAVGVGALALVGVSLNEFEQYDKGLREVNSIAQLSEAELQKVSDKLLALSSDERITAWPRELVAGLNDIYSVGFKGSKALDILKTSALGARAGGAETAVAVDLLTTALNSNIKGAGNTRAVMDSVFQTIADGKIKFSEFNNTLGQTAPFLKAGGVSFKEYGAYMAFATTQGQKAEFATNNLNNLISKLADPPAEAAKQFEKLGIKFGFTELKSKGFTAKMEEITKKTKGNSDALKALFPDMQAFSAAQTIAEGNMKGYNKALDSQNKAMQGAGATQKALQKVNQGFAYDMALLRKESGLFANELGEVVVPQVTEFVGSLRAGVKWFRELDKGTQTNIVKAGAYVGVSLVVIKTLKGVFETVGLVRKAYITLTAAEATAGAVGVTSAGRVGIAWGALAGTAGVFALAAIAAAGFTVAILGTQDAGTKSADALKAKWGPLADVWLTGSDNVNKWATSLESAFKKAEQNPVLEKLLAVAGWTPGGSIINGVRGVAGALSTNNNGAGESMLTPAQKAKQKKANQEYQANKKRGVEAAHAPTTPPSNNPPKAKVGRFYQQDYSASDNPFDAPPIGITLTVLAKKTPRYDSPVIPIPEPPPVTKAASATKTSTAKTTAPDNPAKYLKVSDELKKKIVALDDKINKLEKQISAREKERIEGHIRKKDWELEGWRNRLGSLRDERADLRVDKNDASAKEREAAKKLKKQRNAEQNVREARRDIKETVGQSLLDISALQEERTYLEKMLGGRDSIRNWDKERGTTAFQMKLEQSKALSQKQFEAENSDEVRKLLNAGRLGEAKNVVAGIVGLFKGIQGLEVDVATLDRLGKDRDSNIEGVKGARVGIKKMVGDSAFEIQKANIDNLGLRNAAGDLSGVNLADKTAAEFAKNWSDYQKEWLEKYKSISESSEIAALRKGGREGEAKNTISGIMGRFEGEQGIRAENKAIETIIGERKEESDKTANNQKEFFQRNKELTWAIGEAMSRLQSLLNNPNTTGGELRNEIEGLSGQVRHDYRIKGLLSKTRTEAKTRSQVETVAGITTPALDELRSMRDDYHQQVTDARESDLPQSERLRLAGIRQIAALEKKVADAKAGTAQAQNKANADLSEAKSLWSGIVKEAQTLEGIESLSNERNKARKEWLKELGDVKRLGIDTTAIWQGAFQSLENQAGITFNAIITREKSFGSALRDGILGTLGDIANSVIQSELHNLLAGVFFGALGGNSSSLGGNSGIGNAFRGIGKGLAGSFEGRAIGIERVEKDDQMFRLHRGESVLSAAQAARYREQRAAQLSGSRPSSSRSGSGGSVVVMQVTHTGNIVANSPEEYQRQIQAIGRRGGGRPDTARTEKARTVSAFAAQR